MSMSETERGHGSRKVNGSWNQEGMLASYQTLSSKPYPAPSLLSVRSSQAVALARDRRVKLVSLLVIFNIMCICLLVAWCTSTQSIALQAYTYTVGFNLLSLMNCILSIWVEQNGPTPFFSFGYERLEVLGVFASTVLAQLGSLFITKESIERLVLEQPEIHTSMLCLSSWFHDWKTYRIVDSYSSGPKHHLGTKLSFCVLRLWLAKARLLIGTGVAFVSHIVIIYGCNNAALDHVIAASSSSWLQEHVSDISQSICSMMPIFNALLLPRINPMLLVACSGAVALFLTDLLIQLKSCYIVDTLMAVSIAAVTFATMLPMSIYSGKVLLQTTPSHIVGQLDRCLRETLTIDGVLEFKNEHFWTLSFGKMAGSLQVRVRRDADEQLVLAHVVDRLSNLVSVLTVQVFKDEWTVRSGGITTPAQLLPFPTSSPAPALPHSNSVSSNQNGNSFSYLDRVPFSYTQNSTLPVSHPMSSAQVNVPQMSEPSQRRYPLAETWNVSPQHKNTFLPDFSVPSVQHQAYINNILICGTRTLDANRFAYQPR